MGGCFFWHRNFNRIDTVKNEISASVSRDRLKTALKQYENFLNNLGESGRKEDLSGIFSGYTNGLEEQLLASDRKILNAVEHTLREKGDYEDQKIVIKEAQKDANRFSLANTMGDIDKYRNTIAGGVSYLQGVSEHGFSSKDLIETMRKHTAQEEFTPGANIVKKMGVKNKALQVIMGIGYDMALDPLEWAAVAAAWLKPRFWKNAMKITKTRKLVPKLKLGKLVNFFTNKHIKKEVSLLEKSLRKAKKAGMSVTKQEAVMKKIGKLIQYASDAIEITGKKGRLPTTTYRRIKQIRKGVETSVKTASKLKPKPALLGVFKKTVDELTGVLDQHTFMRMKKSYTGGAGISGYVRLDMDKFKSINKALKHGGGDRVLKRVAQMPKNQVCNIGEVYRAGGDEFAIIFKTGLSEQDMRAILKKIGEAMKLIEVPFKNKKILEKPLRQLTFSSGLVTGKKLKEVFKLAPDKIRMQVLDAVADSLAIKAKSMGRNQILVNSFDIKEIAKALTKKNYAKAFLTTNTLRDISTSVVNSPEEE